MVVQQLSRIPEFAAVCPQELRSFASRARVLCIPARRWLLQNDKVLDAHFYLLHGRIETAMPRRVESAHRRGQLTHFYPGITSARTLTACQILRLENVHRDFLLSSAGTLVTGAVDESWLARFLSSQMMAELPVSAWQTLLAGFERQDFAADTAVIRQGSVADCCFVIEQGHAVVHRGAQTLCHLGPGDFFGEDALVLGGLRNAHVTTLEPVVVHKISRQKFHTLLLTRLVQPVDSQPAAEAGGGKMLNLAQASSDTAGQRILGLETLREKAAGLDPRERYFVVGGRVAERYLCAFLLIQRGFSVRPVVAAHEHMVAPDC